MVELEWSWGRLQEVKLQHRSISQAQEYLDELGGCAYRYFLNRVVRAWDMPAAWLPQGLAVHEAAEFWERSGRKASREEVFEVCRQAYRKHIDRLVEMTPNFNYWNTGWSLGGWDDIVRRAEFAVQQIGRYLDYYEKHPDEQIWITPNGDKAIELEFHMQLDGIKVMGYIDQIIAWYERQPVHLRLRDIKTGKKPGGTLQLKVYDLAIEEEFGLKIGEGDYWMGNSGKPTKEAYDLTAMSRDQVVDLFGRLDKGVRAEEFDPSPDPDKCRMCGVRSACIYAEG
jgi:putative RecB family exonuclease